jgi:hypothetical protein
MAVVKCATQTKVPTGISTATCREKSNISANAPCRPSIIFRFDVSGTIGNSGRSPAQLQLEEAMKKLVISAAVAAFAVTSAFAQTATVSSEYYVVRDATTKKCTIVDKKPTATTTTVVGDGVFKTKTEAETGMKSIKVCTEN